jgi:hypothetical protein
MTFGVCRRAAGPLRLTMGGHAEMPYSRDIPAMSIKQVEEDNSAEDTVLLCTRSHNSQHVDTAPPSWPSTYCRQTCLAITPSY